MRRAGSLVRHITFKLKESPPVMSTLEFYRGQMAKAQAEADAAVLDNVRDRCMRAKAAWADMADRIERTDAMRAGRAASAVPA